MKRKNKLIIICCFVIVSFVISVVPSYAFDGTTWNIQIWDVASETYQTIDVPMMDDAGSVHVVYDPVTFIITIVDNNNETVLEYFLLNGYTADISIWCNGDHISGIDTVTGVVGYGSDTNSFYGTLTPAYDTVYVRIYLITDYKYTLSDLNDARSNAVADVQSNPNNYGLYSSSQYNSYGSSEYNRGYQQAENDITDGQQLSYDRGYERGVADGIVKGQTESKELLGLVNIVLSNIYYTSTYFFNSIGIFGVTLGNIVVSLLIILLVFFIFKIVRG